MLLPIRDGLRPQTTWRCCCCCCCCCCCRRRQQDVRRGPGTGGRAPRTCREVRVARARPPAGEGQAAAPSCLHRPGHWGTRAAGRTGQPRKAGLKGFEPSTAGLRVLCATWLRHRPTKVGIQGCVINLKVVRQAVRTAPCGRRPTAALPLGRPPSPSGCTAQ